MVLHFTKTNGPVDTAIDQLLELSGEVHHPETVREMIIAAIKAGQENEEKADLKLMNSTLKEMRFTSKIFGQYSNIRKVTVFGSARTKPDEPAYKMAYQFGQKLADVGYMVITGAGGGIMEAVNEGAGAANSFGVNIQLPFEQKPNPIFEGSPRLITYKYFFNRKVAFIKEADAVALFPGGFGTLDEAMEILTLMQTGKHDPMPLVLVDEPNGTYWSHCLEFIKKELLLRGYISDTDLNLFKLVRSPEEAVADIVKFYSRFHSLRYVDRKLVLRLSAPLEERAVLELNALFQDILTPGGSICPSCALPPETDETGLADLPRLVIDFNRKDFGRLRKLIDAINSY